MTMRTKSSRHFGLALGLTSVGMIGTLLGASIQAQVLIGTSLALILTGIVIGHAPANWRSMFRSPRSPYPSNADEEWRHDSGPSTTGPYVH